MKKWWGSQESGGNSQRVLEMGRSHLSMAAAVGGETPQKKAAVAFRVKASGDGNTHVSPSPISQTWGKYSL